MIAVKFATVRKNRIEDGNGKFCLSKGKTVCKRDTLNRLSKSHQNPEKPRNFGWIKRGKKQKPKPKVYEEPEKVEMSEQTKKLLSKMNFARRSFLDRDAIVWFEREEKRRELEEEIYGKIGNLVIKNDYYLDWSPEVERMLKERKERKKIEIKMEKNVDKKCEKVVKVKRFCGQRPCGWDKDVTRHRLAYHQRLVKQREQALCGIWRSD
jgi:signal recognition particle GTPase